MRCPLAPRRTHTTRESPDSKASASDSGSTCGAKYPKLLCGPLFVVLLPPSHDLGPVFKQIPEPARVQAFVFAISRENFPHVRSAWAAAARCAPTRSSSQRITPENAATLVLGRCHTESFQALFAPPQSLPAPASLSGSQNYCLPPAPNTLASTRRSDSARQARKSYRLLRGF